MHAAPAHPATPYCCPNCEAELYTLKHSPRDYFCRACCTAVVVLDAYTAVYWGPDLGVQNRYCTIERLMGGLRARQTA